METQLSVAVKVLESLGSVDKNAYKKEKTCGECGKTLGSGMLHTKKRNW
jgi:hypothetical protein